MVNGAYGERCEVFCSTLSTCHLAPCKAVTMFFASVSVGRANLSSAVLLIFVSLALKVWESFCLVNSASIDQYSLGIKARISRSRSTMRRTTTDWTRPAERPRAILRQRNGESS